ncbi:MAG: hypothetical protein GC202_07635 [Alphaproteobacteria bacterium]|nr:hypothetical protein [Alphaproteobacteria bacterium]
MRGLRVFLYAAVLVVAGAGAAQADAIDGNWCSPNGARHLSIDGPKMVTPAGVAIEGSYTRHTFDYVAPAKDVEAGKRVAMRLMSETAVLFQPDGAPQAETWRRCARPIS